MNEELLLLYNGLDAQRKLTLEKVFEDSPKALVLLNLLGQKTQKFRTTIAVNTIYKEELEGIEYTTLVNRFYKLRQYVKDRLLVQLKQTENCFTTAELDLGYARYLKDISEYKYALKILEKLEKESWLNEQFELLPEIINLKIYCVQSTNNDFEVLEACEDKFLEAIELQKALQKIQVYSQRLYRKTYGVERVEGTYDVYQKGLNPIRKLKEKYPNIKRFRMLYHYTAFSRGVVIPKIVEKSRNALHRHLNNFKELWEQYPNIPQTHLQVNFREYTQFRLYNLQSIFYFNKGDFAQALNAMNEKYDLRKKHPAVCAPESDADYHNGILICMCSGAYEDAWKLAEKLLDFYNRHDQEEYQYIAYYDMVSVYYFGFFDFDPPNKELLHKKIKEGFEVAKDERILMYLKSAKLSLAILDGNAPMALDLLTDENTITSYRQLGLDTKDIEAYAQAVYTKDKIALKAIQLVFEQKNKIAVAPSQVYFEHFVKLCEYWLKKIDS